MEGRKRIKNEIMKIDHTFDPVRFAYTDLETGECRESMTAEELRYPMLRGSSPVAGSSSQEVQPETILSKIIQNSSAIQNTTENPSGSTSQPKQTGPVHFTIAENQTGISYRDLFAEYLTKAKEITIIDPYIRKGYQIRNLLEFMQVVLDVKPHGEEVLVHLITDYGDFNKFEIEDNFRKIQDDLMKVDIVFSYEFDTSRTLHARSVSTDTGWKISLDRGFDIFQRFDSGFLSLAGMDQRARYCKAFEITYLQEQDTKVKE